MNYSGIVGLSAAATLLVLTISMVSPVKYFINIPSIVVLIGVVSGLQLMMLGARGFWNNIRVFRIFMTRVPASVISREDAVNLRGLTVHLYAAGAIGSIIGLVQLLANFADPSQLGPAIGVGLLSVFYATALSECLVRPCANRVDYLLDLEESALQSGDTGEAQ